MDREQREIIYRLCERMGAARAIIQSLLDEPGDAIWERRARQWLAETAGDPAAAHPVQPVSEELGEPLNVPGLLLPWRRTSVGEINERMGWGPPR